MIQAVIFYLDGTLIETEKFKAHAYAQAAIELCPYDINEADSLNIPIEDCLILEDSPAGVLARLAAGTEVVAIGTEITRAKLHQEERIS